MSEKDEAERLDEEREYVRKHADTTTNGLKVSLSCDMKDILDAYARMAFEFGVEWQKRRIGWYEFERARLIKAADNRTEKEMVKEGE